MLRRGGPSTGPLFLSLPNSLFTLELTISDTLLIDSSQIIGSGKKFGPNTE